MFDLFSRRKLFVAGSILAGGIALWMGSVLQGCDGDGFMFDISLCNVEPDAYLDSQTRIGGASTVITLDRSDNWALYNVANDLRATQINVTESPKYSLSVAGFIQDIDVVEYPASSGAYYALLSMGDKGIAVINVTDPTNMVAVTSMHVNYEQTGIAFTDGGGNVVLDNTISGSHAPISSLVVYDDDLTVDDNDPYLLIADTAYGLHKTRLANVFDTVAGREDDGTLLIEAEAFTLQYAGENPWGGPKALTLYKDPADEEDKGKLFVALGFLGMGIFDPDTLEQIGGYNLYTDETSVEDWFIDNVVIDQVKWDYVGGGGEGATYECIGPCIDAFTGMPDYRQASYEITEIWHNKVECPPDTECAPWAAFDRYGKFYYNARNVDVATFGASTTAYIAYALGGMVAVDVTGYKDAGSYDPDNPDHPGDPFWRFRKGQRLGYAPAVPANGPDAPTGAQSQSLFPYFGAGMLKESGIVDVKVAGNSVFFSDHFAGLVAIKSADDPGQWHGPKLDADPTDYYDNDTLSPYELGDHWPDYEFVISYDMAPYDPTDNESLPGWLYESPRLLLTGEVSGHGNSFALMPTMDVDNPGQVDIVMASGGGGISFIDVTNLAAPLGDGFAIPVHMTTTDEIYREANGTTSTEGASIGHTAGLASYRNLLFVADGPHGMTVWKIADEERCFPTDDVHLLANTLQDEYPVDTGTEVINPAPHAHDIVLDIENQKAFVMSQSRGLRRVGIEGVDAEEIPVLLKPLLTDIYEHNTTEGSVGDLSMQDHTYDVALDGNLAFVADGSNGLTVYDLSKDPSTPTVDESFVVGNLGGATKTKPLLGHATAVKLWSDTSNANNVTKYAFVAAGHAGIGVVDVTNPASMVLIKVFEPIKTEVHEEDGIVTEQHNKADGKSVDVIIVDDHAYFTYDSFGVLAYKISDLIKPLPEGMDPTKIWERGEKGERPDAVARFKLQDPLLGGGAELAELGGGSQGMFFQHVRRKHYFYIAYDSAGVAKIDWTDVANPILVQHADTVGNASDVEVINGRVYVADGGGGLVLMK